MAKDERLYKRISFSRKYKEEHEFLDAQQNFSKIVCELVRLLRLGKVTIDGEIIVEVEDKKHQELLEEIGQLKQMIRDLSASSVAIASQRRELEPSKHTNLLTEKKLNYKSSLEFEE